MYKVKEIYLTVQGEGFHSGTVAVFCRFAGCNLWSGLEKDRPHAICTFCDTDFRGLDGINGGKYTADSLVNKFNELCKSEHNKFIVFTGGEPALQLDIDLIDHCKRAGFYTAVETNGTLELPINLDWITMSPKPNTEIILNRIDELKFIYPQQELDPKSFTNIDSQHFYLQPLDNFDIVHNTAKCVEFCKENPNWKLSIQTHKYINIP